MIANYHTHTYLCKHAHGTMREYVEAAIQNNFKILGFSDHVPYPFPNGYVSGFRMDVSETKKYVTELKALKREYKKKIEILIGYEAEYYPNDFDNMLKNISKYGYDYLILGQHFTYSEYGDDVYSGFTCDEKALKRYVDTVIEAFKTGHFLYFAHPDLIKFPPDTAIYKKEMKRLCNAAKKYDIPLEFNMLGYRDHRHYPSKEFWKIAGQVGCKAVIGFDVHNPAHMGSQADFNSAKIFLNEYGITPLEKLEIKTNKG